MNAPPQREFSAMTDADQKYRTLLILWIVLLFSQLLFAVVIYSVRGDLLASAPPQPFLGETPAIVIGAFVLAFSNLIISFVVRKLAIERGVAEQNPSYVQTALLLGCAFCEAVSIIGLVLALAFDYQHFYFFLIAGMAGIFLHFPRRRHLLAASLGSRRDGA
jgi:F0F1-type ATP synthase membrane subunit c/vacuolar-type H+-ATPase subunit K